MSLPELFQRICRKLELTLPNPFELLRKAKFILRGASIGRHTSLPPCRMTWPHQVRIGERCTLQHGIFFNYDHHWTPGPSILLGDRVFVGHHVEFNCRERIEVGDEAMIAAGCRLVDSDHGVLPSTPIREQPLIASPIRIGRGAWLGVNVVVLKGVTIGDGAVVGAGAIVTKSIPAGEIWVGVPARRIGCRK